MSEAIRLMRLTFEALANDTAQNQPRRRLILPTGSVLHSMAGAIGPYFGTKFYSTNPRHDAHFLFALYYAPTALPIPFLEASYIIHISQGASTVYNTHLMADPDTST